MAFRVQRFFRDTSSPWVPVLSLPINLRLNSLRHELGPTGAWGHVQQVARRNFGFFFVLLLMVGVGASGLIVLKLFGVGFPHNTETLHRAVYLAS